ncbi:MAG TPA: TIGR04283 family arsenosugar biosynthesis glycosyltransferase [Methylobacter sp.]|jgi:rSAM/selenodomain-associated transferase 2
MKFSIIIPTLNEEKTIASCLLPLQSLRSNCEIIMVDATENQPTNSYPHTHLADKIISSAKGRARQMNIGASHANGDILIFLHADTYLPENPLQLIEQHISNGKQWGRFDIQLSGSHFMLNIIASMMNLRSRLTGIATGDQVIFATKKAFAAVGHYPDIALMEDIALSKALKKISPPVCINAKVTSSGRRWERYGIYRTILLMWSLRLRYFFGADPQLLAALYSRGQFWKP